MMRVHHLLFIEPKYSSAIPGHFMPQRMLLRNVNMTWVSLSQIKLKTLIIISCT